MYYLALNYGSEGWSITEYENLDEIKRKIKIGETFGNEFKVFKEIDLDFKEG